MTYVSKGAFIIDVLANAALPYLGFSVFYWDPYDLF